MCKRFVHRPGLLFHVDRFTGLQRLCIPTSLVKEILSLAHGNGHPGFQRCYQIVTSSWYIHSLVKHLRDFIRHCPECLILQTRRHAPYGSLNPISSPPVPISFFSRENVFNMNSPCGQQVQLEAANARPPSRSTRGQSIVKEVAVPLDVNSPRQMQVESQKSRPGQQQ